MLMVPVAVVEHDVPILVIVNDTEAIPALVYTMPLGFCCIEVPGVELTPKFQFQVTPVVVPVLVKFTGKPEHCGAVEVKLATGVESITKVSVMVAAHWASAIVKVTLFAPAESYTIPPGFCADETDGVEFWPKSHEYIQLPPVLPVLVKLIGVLAHCGAFDVNVAVGVW